VSRFLIVLGILLATAGILIHFGVSFAWLGKLPGDLHIKGGNVNFFFPITTSIILSIFLTVVISLALYRRS